MATDYPSEYLVLDPELVTAHRIVAGYTQTGLAARVGISKQLMNDIEIGRGRGAPATRAAIAKALKVPLERLCTKESRPRKPRRRAAKATTT